MFLSLLQALVDLRRTKWIEVFCFYVSLMTPVICSLTIIIHRDRIRRISDALDIWWHYSLLQQETNEMKRKVEGWMDRFNYYYFAAMYGAAACCVVLPFQKNKFSTEQSGPMDELMVPMWTPFSIEETLGFVTACSLQVLTMWFAFFTFGHLCSYLMTVSVTITHQMKLIETACVTWDERVRKIMQSKSINEDERCSNEYMDKMKAEINNSIIHYQNLYSYVEELCTAFALITNLTYHAGMWAMCLLGVRFVRERENPFILIQASSAIVSLFVNQYLYSHVSETLTDELEELRFAVYNSKWYKLPPKLRKNIHLFQTLLLYIPTLRTIMGTKTNMKNLNQILNASYYYFSMILSFRSKF